MKKNKIKMLFVSCLGMNDCYTISVKRGKQSIGEEKVYQIKASSIANDYLSNMMNRGKFRQHVALSVYPTFILTVKRGKK